MGRGEEVNGEREGSEWEGGVSEERGGGEWGVGM